LDGKTPAVPVGILTSALKTGENRVTCSRERVFAWQQWWTLTKALQQRLCAVGRSLREAEARIDNLTLMLTLTWICALLHHSL